MMKFIENDEAETIRAARKVLEKLCKRYGKLREKSSYVCKRQNDDHCQMFNELNKLKVDVGVMFHAENEEVVCLTLVSNDYLLEYEK